MTVIVILIAAVLISIFLSGFFSGVETGIYRLSRSALRIAVERHKKAHIMLANLLQNTHALIITILIGNNLANYAATALVTYLFLKFGANANFAELNAVIIMTPALFIFGELIPKHVFIYYSDFFMPLVTPLLWLFHRVFTLCGMVPLLGGFTSLVSRITGSPLAARSTSVAMERRQLATIFRETTEEGVLSPMQSEMIERLMSMPSVSLRSVLIPISKAEMLAVDIKRSQVMAALRRNDFTRRCVFEKNRRNVLGFVNIYSVLASSEDFTDLRSFVKPILKLSDAHSVLEAMNIMRTNNARIALVTGAYSSLPVGIVTMKDLVEEFTGELKTG